MATATEKRPVGRPRKSPAEAKAPAPPVTFISTHMRHHVIVDPAEDWYTAHGSRQVKEKGVMLVFNNYRCAVDAGLVDKVKALPEFSGIGGVKCLWVEGEWDTPTRSQDLQVTSGPILAGPKGMPVALPHPGWDTLTPGELEGILASGAVDLERALQYERAGKNRGIVRRMIAQAIVAATDDLDETDDETPVVPDTFGLTTEPGGVA